MQMKLSYKLFGAFFLILAIVSGAMFLSKYLFYQNLRNYIEQMELEKLEVLVPALQEEYRGRGGWAGISTDPDYWRRLMRNAPGEYACDGMKPRRKNAPKFFLMDDRHRPVIGMPRLKDPQQLVAITVEDQVVGWLGLQKREHFRSGPPAALLERQTKQLYILGGLVIGLTALIAFLFSRHLIRPIQRLTWGTRELANREFTIRIKPTTGDELGQLAENFNEMAHTLEHYEKMRRQWLTDISHELRTPLAVLQGEIEAIQDGVRDPTPRNLASLHGEILRISKLVEDLHLLSLADSDSLLLNRRQIFPGQVLEKIAAGYENRLSQRRINIDLSLSNLKSIRIKADPDRLGQVFANILDNACKYVESPGVLKISGSTDDHLLTLMFTDSGPGVPEEALPRLFDRLYRVDASRDRNTGGSGLGLSICRHIIESHGGRIWAEKSAPGGLSIGIELPLI